MRVIITPKATKQYNRLPHFEQTKIKRKLAQLTLDQYAGKKLGGELSELRTLRAWPYRILYYINREKNAVFVVGILHRQGAYK